MKPLTHALLAALYIIGVVGIINRVFVYLAFLEDTLFLPLLMLGLLVLSVATMAYLFFARPLELCFEGRVAEGRVFFLYTLGAFATLVLGYVGALLAWYYFFI